MEIKAIIKRPDEQMDEDILKMVKMVGRIANEKR